MTPQRSRSVASDPKCQPKFLYQARRAELRQRRSYRQQSLRHAVFIITDDFIVGEMIVSAWQRVEICKQLCKLLAIDAALFSAGCRAKGRQPLFDGPFNG